MMKSLSTEKIEGPQKDAKYQTNHAYESTALEELRSQYLNMPESIPQELYNMFQDVDLVTDMVEITFADQCQDQKDPE